MPDRHVHKYFAPRDAFVRVRVVDAPGRACLGELGLARTWDLDARAFREAVVRRFVELPDAADRPGRAGEELALDSEAIEELYRLVVDVNPELDLGSVSLREEAPGRGDVRSATGEDGGRSRLDRRLRRVARDLEARLGRHVLGQEAALASVGRAVRHAAVGWPTRGPRGALLLVGPTGTGKTELARRLAAELGGEETLLRIDCTEFAEGHEYAKLLGAPPGYVGHETGGWLARGLAQGPRTVLLFDEVEKAHPQVHHLLLQILDEGCVTDGRGARLDLARTFVLLTSNAGTRELESAARGIGFARGALDRDARGELVREALRSTFRPELMGRLDELVLFDDLGPSDGTAIAARRLAELAAGARRRGARVRFSGAVAPWAGRRGLAEGAGARGILRVLRRELEAPLAEALLASPAGHGWIDVRLRQGRPRFGHSEE